MNKRATETTLINTLIDSMSMEDFRQYVANDMKDFLYNCSESEVINELLIKVKYTLDEEMLDDLITETKRESKD